MQAFAGNSEFSYKRDSQENHVEKILCIYDITH